MSADRPVPVTALGVLWVAGALLALANQEVALVTTPVFLILDGAYVVVATWLLHRLGASRSGSLGFLAAAPVVLFAIAGHTGAPTGESPGLLLVNTVVLLVVAVAIALAASELVLRHRRSRAAAFAATTVVLLLLGSAGYLLNLAGRVAVVLTGLPDRQAELEGRYWVAAEYLRGLPTNDDPLAYLLTWMDLVQLGYMVTAYVAAAGLARLLVAEHVVPARTGTCVERTAWSAAGLLVAAIVLAVALPHEADAVPAGLAFALSIPFMSTLLPFALAVSALRRAAVESPTTSVAPRRDVPIPN